MKVMVKMRKKIVSVIYRCVPINVIFSQQKMGKKPMNVTSKKENIKIIMVRS